MFAYLSFLEWRSRTTRANSPVFSARYSAKTAVAIRVLQNALQVTGATYTITTLRSYPLSPMLDSKSVYYLDVVAGTQQFFGTQTDIQNAIDIISGLNINSIADPLIGTGSIFGTLSSSLDTLSQLIGGPCTTIDIIRASLGQTSGQAGFITAADLNGDGVIDELDFASAARSLPVGTRCPALRPL